FTTPIANVVTRKQTAAMQAQMAASKKGKSKIHHKHRLSSLRIAQDIYAEHGASGFWAGYKPTLFLTMNPAITFLMYEVLKKTLPRRYRKEQTKTQTFLLGALAKAFASTITYPLAVVKTRSMIQS